MYNSKLDNIVKNTGIMVDSISTTWDSYPEITGHIIDNTAWETICTDKTVPNINTIKKENWLYNGGSITASPSPVITIHPETKTILNDVHIKGDLTFEGGKAEKLIIDEDDIIMLTFDNDMYDVDEIMNIFNMWVEAFPNHKIISNLKGVEISLIKDKGRKNNEVSW